MSARIYGGMRALDDDVFALAHDAGLVINNIFGELFAASLATARQAVKDGTSWQDAFEVLDDVIPYAAEPVSKRERRTLEATVHAALMAVTNSDVRSAPFGCTLTYGYDLLFMGNAAGGNALAIMRSEADVYREALLAEGIFEDYPYWDGSDRPDEVSSREWAIRRQAWGIGSNHVLGAGVLRMTTPGSIDAQVLASAARKKHSEATAS